MRAAKPLAIVSHRAALKLASKSKRIINGCLEWTGYTQEKGYGEFRDLKCKVLVHRAAFVLNKGPLLAGVFVLHTCDNPRCIEPLHLYTGDHDDNMRDMVAHARSLSGVKNHRHVLTDAEVLAIRASKKPHRKLARDYGVSKTAISAAKGYKTWKHLP